VIGFARRCVVCRILSCARGARLVTIPLPNPPSTASPPHSPSPSSSPFPALRRHLPQAHLLPDGGGAGTQQQAAGAQSRGPPRPLAAPSRSQRRRRRPVQAAMQRQVHAEAARGCVHRRIVARRPVQPAGLMTPCRCTRREGECLM